MTQTIQDLVAAAAKEVDLVDLDEARKRYDAGAVMVDVREPAEWINGRIAGAVHVPRGLIEFQLPNVLTERAKAGEDTSPLILYCGAGPRAALAAQSLGKLGIEASALAPGGYKDWAEAGHPVEE